MCIFGEDDFLSCKNQQKQQHKSTEHNIDNTSLVLISITFQTSVKDKPHKIQSSVLNRQISDQK